MFGGGDPLLPKILDQTDPVGEKTPIFYRYSLVTPSEKSSVNSNRKFTTRFPMSLRWTAYVALKPQKGCSKTQNGRFPSKIALNLKKVYYKVFLLWILSATKL